MIGKYSRIYIGGREGQILLTTTTLTPTNAAYLQFLLPLKLSSLDGVLNRYGSRIVLGRPLFVQYRLLCCGNTSTQLLGGHCLRIKQKEGRRNGDKYKEQNISSILFYYIIFYYIIMINFRRFQQDLSSTVMDKVIAQEASISMLTSVIFFDTQLNRYLLLDHMRRGYHRISSNGFRLWGSRN